MSVAAAGAKRRRLPVSGDTLVLCGLLLLFAGLSYGIARQSKPPSPLGIAHRSSFATDSGGWKAFYRLLEKRQNRVRRFQRRPKEWPATAGVVVTGPYSIGGAVGQWAESEPRDALRWVSEGGVLIAFTDATDDLTEALGVRTSEKAPIKVPAQDLFLKKTETKEEWDEEAPTLKPRTFHPGPDGSSLTVEQPALFLEGVSKLNVPGKKRFTAGPEDSIRLVADNLPVVLAIPSGDGLILAVSDAGIPDNSHLAKADNARFVVQMAEAYTTKKRPTILFDEYHQGYRDADTFWTAIGRPGQLAFWQIAGLCLLMAYSASRRFGLTRPVDTPSRVSSEYVSSLADLYRRARAADAALDSVHRIFWRDMCRAAGMGTDALLPEVALRVAGQTTASDEAGRTALAERVITIVTECREKTAIPIEPVDENPGKKKKKQPKPKPALSEGELLRLVTAIEMLRKELELGGRNPV